MINVDELRNNSEKQESVQPLVNYQNMDQIFYYQCLPFDFVIYYNNKFYRTQVKTVNNSLNFSLTSNNYNKGTVHKYNEDEIDIMICCDLHNIYIFPECDVANRNSITIREEPPANNQTKGINFAKDCIISIERLNYTFSKIEK